MKPKHHYILLGVTFLIWIVLWNGKRLSPEMFGGEVFQWGGLFIFTLLSSVGSFLAFSKYFRNPPCARDVGICGLGFMAMFLINVAFHGVACGGFAANYVVWADQTNSQMLDQVIRGLPEETDTAARDAKLRFIYQISGTALLVQNSDGTLETYRPTESDIDQFIKNERTQADLDNLLKLCMAQFNQLLWVIPIEVFIYFLTHCAGVLVLAFRKQADNQFSTAA